MANFVVPFSTTVDSNFTYQGNTYRITRLVKNKFNDAWSFNLVTPTRTYYGIVVVGGQDILQALGKTGLPNLVALNTLDAAEEPTPENMSLYIFEDFDYV